MPNKVLLVMSFFIIVVSVQGDTRELTDDELKKLKIMLKAEFCSAGMTISRCGFRPG